MFPRRIAGVHKFCIHWRMKLKSVKFLLTLFLIVSLASCATFSPADRLYKEARQFTKEGKPDFVFLSLSELLREDPDYRFASEAKFAIAEYHFLNGNYARAVQEWIIFLNSYPDSELKVFAKAMLYKIISDSRWQENEEAAEVKKEIQAQFFSKPAFFVFSEFKETDIVSLLGNHYVLRENVERIEILQNGKLFFSVSP